MPALLHRCLIVLTLLPALLAAPPGVSVSAEPGFVGMQVRGIDKDVAEALGLDLSDGAVVVNVALGGPGNWAGFERGDVVLTFNGQRIDAFTKLTKAVQETAAGDEVPVTVLRGGQEKNLVLKLGKRPEAWKVNQRSIGKIPELGLTLASATPKVRESFNLPWGSFGVLVTVTDVRKSEGLKITRGDLIRQINQQEVWRPEQVIEIYRAAKQQKRRNVLLLVEGVGGFRLVLLPVR